MLGGAPAVEGLDDRAIVGVFWTVDLVENADYSGDGELVVDGVVSKDGGEVDVVLEEAAGDVVDFGPPSHTG